MNRPVQRDRDERVALPLDPEEALRALLAVPLEDDEDERDAPAGEDEDGS